MKVKQAGFLVFVCFCMVAVGISMAQTPTPEPTPLPLVIRKAHRIQDAAKEDMSIFIRGIVAAAESKAQTIENGAGTTAQKAVALRSIISTLDATFEIWIESNLAEAYVYGDDQTKRLLEVTAKKILQDKRDAVQVDLAEQDAGLNELDEIEPIPEP